MLARIEKLEGVLDAWTDKSGTRIVVSVKAKTSTQEAIALVSSELAPKYGVKEVTGAEATEAVKACQSGSPGWFRARETIALSSEEAQVLAARSASRAAEKAGLDAGQRETFEKRVRETLLRVFEEQHKKDGFDGRALSEKLCGEVEKVVDDMDLTPEQKKKLRDALEAERLSRSSKVREGKSP